MLGGKGKPSVGGQRKSKWGLYLPPRKKRWRAVTMKAGASLAERAERRVATLQPEKNVWAGQPDDGGCEYQE